MKFIAFDTESHLIKPGLLAPKMVCLSLAFRGEEKIVTELYSRDNGLRLVHQWLLNDDLTLIGHNLPFDLGVVAAADLSLLPLIFDKYDKGLLFDTMTRQQLIDVAEGQAKFFIDEETGEFLRSSYTLADLSYRLNKRFIKKGNDTWRLRYALLDGQPISSWPDDAKKYAIDDAEVTLELFESQQATIEKSEWCHNDNGGVALPNQTEQHKAAWALHLMSMWGVRTDGAAVAKLKAALEIDYTDFMGKLRPSGLFNIEPERVNRKGVLVPEKVTKSMKVIYERVGKCFKDRGESAPLTETGRIATDRKTLLATDDPELKVLAEAGGVQKLLTTYVPQLEAGTIYPINARYNVLMETGRTSCSGPNLQNPPRKGGVRECFIPRPGWVLVFTDYDTLELRSFAQVCLDLLGRSDMAIALRRGDDLHLSFAAELLGIDPAEAMERYAAGDPVVKEARQHGKIANFGFPGGLGEESFVTYAEGFGLKITREKAGEIRDAWFARWSESRPYFDLIGRLAERDQITQVRSGRVRGGPSFCAVANGFFQSLAADGAKEALWNVARECYVDRSSPLFGCRPTLFLHDEIGMEVPYHDPVAASAAADRLAEVMISSMAKWIPDVPITAKPIMCRRWFKGAEAVRIEGVLVPSRPEKIDGKTKWVADVDGVVEKVA